jgi:hypothetical protein
MPFWPVVVPPIANVCVAASWSAMKNDGFAGVVIFELVIVACAAGVATKPPATSALPSAAVTNAILVTPTS